MYLLLLLSLFIFKSLMSMIFLIGNYLFQINSKDTGLCTFACVFCSLFQLGNYLLDGNSFGLNLLCFESFLMAYRVKMFLNFLMQIVFSQEQKFHAIKRPCQELYEKLFHIKQLENEYDTVHIANTLQIVVQSFTQLETKKNQ